MPTSDQQHESRIPLAQLKRGQRATIDSCNLDGKCAAMIEAMGLDRDAQVSIARIGDPCIVLVHHTCGGSCRIGLRRNLADQISVRPDAIG